MQCKFKYKKGKSQERLKERKIGGEKKKEKGREGEEFPNIW